MCYIIDVIRYNNVHHKSNEYAFTTIIRLMFVFKKNIAISRSGIDWNPCGGKITIKRMKMEGVYVMLIVDLKYLNGG